MCRTGLCRFGFGNWIFLLAIIHLFTFIQGAVDPVEELRITGEPRDVLAASGARLVLHCGAGVCASATAARDGARETAVQWRHAARPPLTPEHALLDSDAHRKQLSNGSLVIWSLSPSLAGLYQCACSAPATVTGAVTRLVVLSRQASVTIAQLPSLSPGRRVVSAVPGGPALLPCPVRAEPRVPTVVLTQPPPAAPRRGHKAGLLPPVPPTRYLNITWALAAEAGGSSLGPGGRWSPARAPGRATVTPSGALELDPVTPQDAAAYVCRVALADAPHTYVTSDEIELRVDPDPEGSEYPPRFVTTPLSATVVEGSSVTFDCAAVGNPKPEIVWLHNGVAIDLSELDSGRALVGGGSLWLRGVRPADGGGYTCRAGSRLRSADHTASLTVLTAPRVSLPSGPAAVARSRGDVTLRCDVRGRPAPTVGWFKDGEPLTPNNHDIALVDGSSLRIQGVLPLDEGVFQCGAWSVAGHAIAALWLSVRPDETVNTSKSTPSTMTSFKHEKATKHVPTQMNSTQDIFNSLISSSSLTDDILEPEDVDFLGETSSAYTMRPEVGFDESDLSPEENVDNRLEDGYDEGVSGDELDLSSLVPANASTLSPPRSVRAALAKPRFVALTWDEPEVTVLEVSGYIVVYKVNGSHRERVWATSGSQRSLNVAGLQPNTTYGFSVIATAGRIASTPSEVVHVGTPPEEALWPAPRSLRVTAAGPHALSLSWQPPLGAHAPPTKYIVYYTEAESGREQVQWVESEPEPSPAMGVITAAVGGLRAGRQYAVRVGAAGGALSPPLRAATPTAAPSEPPHAVTAEPRDTSIVVRWAAPPLRSHRGPLTGYTVRYRRKGTATGSTRADSLTTPADVRQAELTPLEPGTTYQIRVCALNANGSGPYSEWLETSTRAQPRAERTVPGTPPPLTTRAGRDWVSVWWSPSPREPEWVRGYVLGWGVGVPDERTAELPAHRGSHVIRNLEPNSEYVISLRAGNSLGLGPAVYATVRTKAALADGDGDGDGDMEDEDEREGRDEDDEDGETEPPLIPPVGVKAIMLSGTTAVVYWTDPTLPKGQPLSDERRYVVRWSAAGGSAGQRPRTFNATDLNCMIDDLKPFTTYEFAVKLIKGGRSSPWSLLAANTSLEAPPAAPRAPSAAPPPPPAGPARAALLSWQPPARPNGIITGYVITYAVAGSEQWSAVTSPGGSTRARVDRLRPRTAYTFRVQARNGRGLGAASPAVHYTTAKESSGAGSGLVGATAAWLWAAAGGACAVLALAAALAASLCCRRHQPPLSPPTSTYQKSSASAGIKPPDLWIHHDQMELRHTDKSLRESHASVGSTEGALASSSLTLARAAEYDPPRRTLDSLDRRTYVPTYVERAPSHASGSDDTALCRQSPTYYRCHYTPTSSMTGMGMGVGSMGSMGGMGMVGGMGGVGGCSNTCERRLHARNMHPDQSTPLLSAVCPLGSPQPSLQSLQPAAPCGSASCPLGASCGAAGGAGMGPGLGTGGTAGTAGTLGPAGTGTAGTDIYACAARARGHYVAYEPLSHYTHRDSLSSEGGIGGGSGTGTIGSTGPGSVGPSGSAGPGGSLPRRAGPLHSFSDNSDHSTPTHSNRSVRESSPYKKSNNSSPGHAPNRLQLGGAVAHCPEELESLTPSRSTERLQREMQNLEGLMKDLSAITQHQFQC